MKKIIILALISIFTFYSCDNTEDDDIPEYAMTAKINGETFEANNPYGTNEFSSTNIYTYYPTSDFVMLQGRAGYKEIDIWLKKSDIAVGSYIVPQHTGSTTPSHFIDLIDPSNSISEYTKEGVIVITNVSNSIVTGTFEFTTVDSPYLTAIDYTVTEGTFRYKYE